MTSDDLSQLRKQIREELKAAEQARIAHNAAIGELLRNAIGDMTFYEFKVWAYRNLRLTRVQIEDCLEAAGIPPSAFKPTPPIPDEWEKRFAPNGPVIDNIERARRELERDEAEAQVRRQEREAEAKVAQEIIKVGYRALAAKHHPDKGGTADAMKRLTKARERLRSNV